MILTVTPNPALDLTWNVDRLHPGETHRVATGAVRAGGKGLNVARVLHAVGEDVHALTTTGGASGAELAADVDRSGIPATLIPVAGATRRSIAVVDDEDGSATVLNEHGAALSGDEATRLLDAFERLGGTSEVVAVSGSLPPGLAADDVAGVIARLRSRGIPVVADLGGAGMLAAARAGASVLKPNREELAAATGDADPLTGARRLIALGAQIVVASLGHEGLLAVTADEVVRARLPRVLKGNATGAGDAAVAAIALALAEGARSGSSVPDLSGLARRATAWSASAVLMPLAGDLHPDHVALADEVLIDDPESE